MEIQRTISYSPAFSAKFVNNKSFQNLVKYAQEKGCMRTLDSSLHSLSKVDNAVIRICDGTTPDGKIYSTFMSGRRSVPNDVFDAKTPSEATLDGIIELSMFGKKYKSLIGVSRATDSITPQSMIKDYTV